MESFISIHKRHNLFYAIVISLSIFISIFPYTNAKGQSTDIEDTVEHTDPNRTVVMGRGTWDTGWFQAEVYKQLIEELGYTVDRPRTYERTDFYQKLSAGELDLWVNGWFPNSDLAVEPYLISGTIELVGTTVIEGGYQVYVIDKKSADELSISNLGDFADPTVAAHFDKDGDGKAELIGCESHLNCFREIEHHIESYGLHDTVEQLSGEYLLMTQTAVRQAEDGHPFLMYTWMPNWILHQLQLGEDVIMLEVPFASSVLKPDITDSEIGLHGVLGCASDPCNVGYPPNDIRPVANKAFLDARPAIRQLLADVQIPLEDIAAQNLRMVEGEWGVNDIPYHAYEWIEENRQQVDEWIMTARAVGEETGTLLPQEISSNENLAAKSNILKVIALPQEPFVMYRDNQFYGFSIDYVKMVAEEIGYEVDIHVVSSLAKMIDELERGAAAIGMGGFNATSEREEFIDFSLPIMSSGLKIMVTAESANNAASLWYQLLSVFSLDILYLILFLILMLLLCSHIIWFVERHTNAEFTKPYWPGIADAFWWSAVTVTTVGYGDKTPRGLAGRVVGLIWMFMGLFIVAYFTAGVTSSITLHKLNGFINGPEDLPGKSVATVSGTTIVDYLEEQHIRTTLVPEIQEAYDLLEAGEVDAVVYDDVVLDYHVLNDGNGTFITVGDSFEESYYAYLVAPNSVYVNEINIGLLKIQEKGLDKNLLQKWFGDRESDE
ncbi:MAG: glycine betaine/L-proline ABC transporter substrate-binding protein ProX [Chloroflexota bacterium]